MTSRFLPRGPAIAVVVAGLLAGCGGSSKPATHQQAAATGVASLNGPRANPPFKSEPLALRNFDGKPVNIASYRGRAVLVTFIYTHCPDTCPLIVSNLHTAQSELGPEASKLQIVAVSVDPRGDTPKTVAAFLRRRQMLGRMDYLIGTRSQLQAVWKRWGILARAASTAPEDVEHSALIYGIGASGRVYTLYPANFKPQWIAYDVPILASH